MPTLADPQRAVNIRSAWFFFLMCCVAFYRFCAPDLKTQTEKTENISIELRSLVAFLNTVGWLVAGQGGGDGWRSKASIGVTNPS